MFSVIIKTKAGTVRKGLHLMKIGSRFTRGTSKPWEIESNLPKNVVPSVYNLLLHPNLEKGTFSGNVDITLNVAAPTEYIVLNQKGLTIENSALRSENGSMSPIKQAFDYPEHQFWIIQPSSPIAPGTYHLVLDFSGSLTDSLLGFYRSSYKNPNNETRYIATTKFEPTHARQAFPCFDEPSFKAKFNVSLVRPSEGNYIALSNMDQMEEVPNSPGPGLTTVRFNTSLPMSTYLACFIVCDFAHPPSIKTKGGVDVNVYARSDQIKKMDYTQKYAVQCIEFYNDYFGIDYPLPKLDIIAIPDFVSGAMENWGLITYRESRVMYDPNFSSITNLVTVSIVAAHEISHMWFGDLVTMKWWDDLWLNEGFASFMQCKGVQHSYPEWDIDTYFLISRFGLLTAMTLDYTLSSHPIIQHVSKTDQINEIFDKISYAKGASVIRMLEGFMGEENFKKGVISYLNKFQYKNAETNDLWQHMQEFSGSVNVQHVMDTWTRQMGFPVLTVTRKGDTIEVTQQRFTADKNSVYDINESPFKYKWDVPVTIITSSNKKPSLNWLLMDKPSLGIDVKGTEWYKLNFHFVGFYRVNYPPEDWATLTKLLTNDITALDAADRGNLIDDAFSLAASGWLDFPVVMSLTDFLQKEEHFVVWTFAEKHLLAISNHLMFTPAYSDYRRYLRKVISPHINDSLWEFSPDATFIRRNQQLKMISLGCTVGVPACLDKVKEIFTAFLKNDKKPDVELRDIVYSYGVAESGELQWDMVWNKYVAETDIQESSRLLDALCRVRMPWIVFLLVERMKNEEYVKSQDYVMNLVKLAHNPVASDILWDWMRTNWQYLVDRFTIDSEVLGRLLPAVTASFSTEIKLKEVEDFITQYPEAGAGATGRKLAVETIKLNIAWLKNHLPTISEWLKKA